MASLMARRAANSLTWSFNYSTRSRTLANSFIQTEHARRRRRQHSDLLSQHHTQQYARAFSSQPARYATAPPARSASTARPASTTAARPVAATTATGSTTNASPATPNAPPPSRPTAATPAAQPSRTTAAPPSQAAPQAATPAPPRYTPPPPTARNNAATSPSTNGSEPPIRDMQRGLSDAPPNPSSPTHVDWTTSYHGLSNEAFSKEASDILLQPLNSDDIEIKPDGIIYLPEIKYRRILNRAFGPGAWGLAPRGETIVTAKSVTREYALLVHGRLVSIARGEQDYFDSEGIPTATEGCKSNALMRCCKDLGVASELWDPRFIRGWLKQNAREVWVEHSVSKKKRKITLRKDDEVKAPYKESKGGF